MDSQLYESKLSNFERFKNDVEISKSRALYMENSWSGTIFLPLKHHRPFFTVEISIGTPEVKRALIFDTGSELTWTKCKIDVERSKQDPTLFDTKRSSSYKQLTKDHKFSKEFNCTKIGCFYNVSYYSGQSSKGIASLEDFTFGSTIGDPYKASGLVFGCGTTFKGYFGTNNIVSGVLGMNKEPLSFARQLGAMIKARFSYCLNTKSKQTYVRFGEEALLRETNFQSSPFLKLKEDFSYRLNMTDISINGKRLGLKRNAFPKGCVIDSGASLSLIPRKIYYDVTKLLKKYFAKFNYLKRISGGHLCYTSPRGFSNFPNMTFHFQGANLDVPPENLYRVDVNFFCLEIISSKDLTLLGTYQQKNMRFVFDLDKEMISFAKEDCSKDVA